MNWSQAGTIVATVAPTLGSIVGGFIPIPGGSMIGQKVGEIIADTFGVPKTPDAVAAAIQGSPEAVVLANLQAATERAKIEVEGVARVFEAEAKLIAATTESVGVTMRAEIGHQHPFYTGWRAGAGWVFNIGAIDFGVLLTIAVWRAINGDTVGLSAIVNAWPIFLAFFGTLAAMVGVYVVRRPDDVSKVASKPVPPVPATKPPLPTKRA